MSLIFAASPTAKAQGLYFTLLTSTTFKVIHLAHLWNIWQYSEYSKIYILIAVNMISDKLPTNIVEYSVIAFLLSLKLVELFGLYHLNPYIN